MRTRKDKDKRRNTGNKIERETIYKIKMSEDENIGDMEQEKGETDKRMKAKKNDMPYCVT